MAKHKKKLKRSPRSSGTKNPCSSEKPSSEKMPRRGSEPQSSDHETIVWHLNAISKDSQWGWTKVKGNEFWKNIAKKMSNFESMTWADIKRNGDNHSVSIGQICSDARKWLREKRLEDNDELFSLHLAGKQRIWGIRDGRVLKVLWWDPNHTVYPVQKKHT